MGKVFGHKLENYTGIISPGRNLKFVIKSKEYHSILNLIWENSIKEYPPLIFEYFKKCQRCGLTKDQSK